MVTTWSDAAIFVSIGLVPLAGGLAAYWAIGRADRRHAAAARAAAAREARERLFPSLLADAVARLACADAAGALEALYRLDKGTQEGLGLTALPTVNYPELRVERRPGEGFRCYLEGRVHDDYDPGLYPAEFVLWKWRWAGVSPDVAEMEKGDISLCS